VTFETSKPQKQSKTVMDTYTQIPTDPSRHLSGKNQTIKEEIVGSYHST
jgi:hypothetical protein